MYYFYKFNFFSEIMENTLPKMNKDSIETNTETCRNLLNLLKQLKEESMKMRRELFFNNIYFQYFVN